MSDIFEEFKYHGEKLLDPVLETAAWLEDYEHEDEEGRIYWDILPGKDIATNLTLTSRTSLYGGTAGIALFFLRLYRVTKDKKWLEKAEGGVKYLIAEDQGDRPYSDYGEGTLLGIPTGLFNGPTGGAYVSYLLYETTGIEAYKKYAIDTAHTLISVKNLSEKGSYWSGQIGILSDGGLVLFLIWLYEKTGNEEYLKTADDTGRYIASKAEETDGGVRWQCMDSVAFGLGKNGYFPGFFYGTAGTGYILAKLYEQTRNDEYLRLAVKASEYLIKIADTSSDNKAALIRYNDPYVPRMHYLGVCQGPIGTSRLFYELYKITDDKKYYEWILKLTEGVLYAGAPKIHSKGYWHTYCYCCGAAGMTEHFAEIYELTGDKKYLEAAKDSADVLIGDSNLDDGKRRWYTAWNRHAPDEVECWSGLYLGSSGCASSLLYLYNELNDKADIGKYIEDPFK